MSLVVIRCRRSYYKEQRKKWTGQSIASLLRIADDRSRWAVNTAEASVGVSQRRLGVLVSHRTSAPFYFCEIVVKFCPSLLAELIWNKVIYKLLMICFICRYTRNILYQVITSGTRAADMLANFVGRSPLMRINWIFWCTCNYHDFPTPINSKWRTNCHRLAVIWRGSLKIPNFGG